MTLEYIGANYAGWQFQINAVSIQQIVENALEKLTGNAVRVTASGRTDAGVHARNQPVHADVTTRMTDAQILKGMNAVLPKDIAVKFVGTVADDWHARFSAVEKTYRYTILNRLYPSAFDHGRVWLIHTPMDVEAMREAAGLLVGEHDFSSFRSAGCSARSPVRNLSRLDITTGDEGYIYFTLTASGFLKQMVRNIVGSLVDVGRGRMAPGGITAILLAKDRTKAGPCAPPEGLCLMDVVYGD